MAIVATAVINNPNYKVWSVQCLDADTGPTNVAHGFGATPVEVTLSKTVSAAAPPEWSATWDGTNIALSKLNAAGSGGAVPGTTVVLWVYARRPHTNAR